MTSVDFMSLDVEDWELYALQGIDFSIVDIPIITVELAGRVPDREAKTRKILIENGYTFLRYIRSPRNESRPVDELWARV